MGEWVGAARQLIASWHWLAEARIGLLVRDAPSKVSVGVLLCEDQPRKLCVGILLCYDKTEQINVGIFCFVLGQIFFVHAYSLEMKTDHTLLWLKTIIIYPNKMNHLLKDMNHLVEEHESCL